MDNKQKGSNLKSKLAGLYTYMSARLKINKSPKLVLINDEPNSNQAFGMTGYYDPKTRTIVVYTTSRHPTDILRSFAHELIHHWQNEHGQLNNETKAHYTQQDPQLRKKEMEAYLLGNILFRDWQDEQRHGPPQKEPFLVSLNENLAISNPRMLKDIIRQMIQKLIADKIIVTYQRQLSSAQMSPEDFVEDFANKISGELGSQIELINNRGNWENQGAMVK